MHILVELLVAIPMMISLYLVQKGQYEKAFLNVYLPTLLLAPSYMSIHVPHIPIISIEEGALIPIGAGLLLKGFKDWPFTRLDLWILLFALGEGYSELRSTTFPTAAFVLYTAICSPVFSYVIGKRLIEQKHLRVRAAQRIALMIALVIVPVLYEYRMGQNPYLILRSTLFPEVVGGWMVQMRSGHARTAGPYGHAILAGMVFATGLVFNTWLRYAYYRRVTPGATLFARLQRYYIPSIVLLAALLMTRSRGPLLGAVVAIMIAQIARFKNVRLASAIVLITLIGGGIVGYGIAQKYTGAAEAQDEQQGSAIYRRQLLDNYKPIVEAGGWFGWGVTDFPKVPGQESIDNQYLFLEVTQGRLGLIMFLLIGAETVYGYGKAVTRARNQEDRMFAFSMLGIIIGLFVSLLTVFMGSQVQQLIYIIAGWSASVQMNGAVSERTEHTANLPAYAFRRVIT